MKFYVPGTSSTTDTVDEVEEFTYQGSVVNTTGGADQCVEAVWRKTEPDEDKCGLWDIQGGAKKVEHSCFT